MAKFTPTATYDDVNLVLRLYDMRREERMRKARAWFVAHFHAASFEQLQQLCPPGTEDNTSFRMVASYWDMVSSFITAGVLNPDLFFESNRELLLVYLRLEKLLPSYREANKDPFQFKNLETVGKEYATWMDARAPGSFEAFAGRVRGTS